MLTLMPKWRVSMASVSAIASRAHLLAPYGPIEHYPWLFVLDQDGKRQSAERPQQLFTRWYGFSLTFPGCEIAAN